LRLSSTSDVSILTTGPDLERGPPGREPWPPYPKALLPCILGSVIIPHTGHMLANVRGLGLGQNRTKQTNNPYVDRSPPGSRSGLAIATVHQGVSSFLDRSLLRTRESRRLYPRTTELRCSYPCTTHSSDLGRRRGRNYGTTADGRGTAVWRGASSPSRRLQFGVDAITNCRRRTRDSQFKLPPLYPLCTII
jgi:hypothetical protein